MTGNQLSMKAPGVDSEVLASAADLLQQAQRIAILTGAGISAESGIPTFRDSLTGLWQRFDAVDLATPEAFQRDKALVWGWYEWRRMKVMRAQPNPGHWALAELARQVPASALITQNVDDLHERAGSQDVIHLHGSLLAPRCFACARAYTFADEIPNEPEGGRQLQPPKCPHCGGYIRPGIVWFGETLPEDAWHKAETAVRACDVLLAIGTSGLVYPAAGLPTVAREGGKPVILVGPNPTGLDDIASHILRGEAGEILPALMKLIRHDALK
jgi:NAD-dependent deacetylase